MRSSPWLRLVHLPTAGALAFLLAACAPDKPPTDTADRDGDGVPDADDCAPDDAGTSAGSPWYADADGDGYGDASTTESACTAPTGYVPDATDCDDGAAAAHPGAEEIWYDGADEDCTGGSDFDQDGDGYDRDAECDDLDPTRFPDASVAEVWYDGVDQNCDGNDGDKDGDGWYIADYPFDVPTAYAGRTGDCWDDPDDDSAWTALNGFPSPAPQEVHPTVADAPYDGLDADCAGDDDFDADGDTHRTSAWPDAGAAYGDDCDDTDPLVYAGAADAPYDGLDADCAGDDDYDGDHDGYDASGGSGPVDCDDTSGDISPGASENCETAADDDCDGDTNDEDAKGCILWYLDADGDTYGTPTATCTCVSDGDYRATDSGDCNDADARVNPGVAEVCDGIDGDCDGVVDDGFSVHYVDDDGDGYGAGSPSCVGTGASVAGDCDDADPHAYPGAPELCDATQNDCTISTWSSADESNLASVESASGVWTDVTASLAGAISSPTVYTLPGDGTLHVCPGVWYTRLYVPSAFSTTTVDAPWGPGTAYLDAGSAGSVITATTSGASLTVRGVTLQNGYAGYGAGINASGMDVLLEDAVLSTNHASQLGGGLYASAGSVTLRNTGVDGNISGGSGGGLYVYQAPLVIEDSVISGNSTSALASSGGAGAAWIGSGSETLSISGSTFESNTVYVPGGYGYAGGLYAYAGGSGAVQIGTSAFTDNVVSTQQDAWGGGIALFTTSTSVVEVDDIDVAGNLVGAEYDPEGGGVYLVSSGSGSVTFTGGSISGNSAWGDRSNLGGGMSALLSGTGAVTLAGTTLADNTTSSYGGSVGIAGVGGAVYADLDGASLELSAVSIRGNDALQGDGISLTMTGGSTLSLSGASEIVDNVGEGLALHTLDTGSAVTLLDTVVSGNDTYGLYLYPASGSVTNVTCTGSSAEAAGIYANGTVGVFGYYSASGAVGYFTASACDFDDPTTGVSNGLEDLALGGTAYGYGPDATFSCVGGTCL